MASIERQPYVTTARPRGGGRFVVAVLAVGVCLALSAAANAAVREASIAGDSVAAAAMAPIATPEPLVSPQYQAEIADTGTRAGPTGPAADPSGGGAPRAAAGSDPEGLIKGFGPVRIGTRGSLAARPAQDLRPGQTWYQTKKSRYQLHVAISNASHSFRHVIVVQTPPSIAQLIPAWNSRDKVISAFAGTQGQSKDARRLLQLGFGLGLAYLVFLVCWFWATRNKPHGVGRVVRF